MPLTREQYDRYNNAPLRPVGSTVHISNDLSIHNDEFYNTVGVAVDMLKYQGSKAIIRESIRTTSNRNNKYRLSVDGMCYVWEESMLLGDENEL